MDIKMKTLGCWLHIVTGWALDPTRSWEDRKRHWSTVALLRMAIAG